MDRSIYDTKDGIATMLSSYEDIYELHRARREACYDRSERLASFVILGRFYTDGCGNWTKLNRMTITDDLRRQMPAVMTMDEFNEFMQDHSIDGWNVYEGMSGMSSGLPPSPRIVCARCGVGWSLENCHDYDDEGGFEESRSLGGYVGKTLREVQEELDDQSDAAYRVHTAIRNDRWVDNSPDHKRYGLGREEGWRSEDSDDPQITMDYIVQPGDHGNASFNRYYHGDCFKEMMSEDEAAEGIAMIEGLTQMFEGAGFDGVVITKIPLPQHIRDWMLQDEPDLDDDELDAASDELTYLRVETGQGTFGIFIAAYPAIDLTGTGIELKELVPEMEDAPPDFPAICGFDGDPAILLKLWQLLTKSQTASKG